MYQEYWTREELYDLAWSKPFTELAKEYEISDVGLRKTCQKLDIPVPKAGYWAKIRSGKMVVRPPLPANTTKRTALKPPKRTTISVKSGSKKSDEPIILDENKRGAYLAALSYESDPEHAIVIHPGSLMTALGQKTLMALMKPPKDGLPSLHHQEGLLDIRVSPNSAKRAISICEALMEAFELRGWKFTLGSGKTSGTMEVSIFDFSIPFWIEETLERKEHILTPEEKKDKVKNPWRYSKALYDRIPTGLLTIYLEEKHRYGNPGYRFRWSDGKRMRLEKEIGDFCTALIYAVIKKRNSAIESEKRKREWEEEEKQRKKKEYLRSLDERRIKNLAASIDRYEMMIKTRAYIDYVRVRAQAQGQPLEEDLVAWLDWAEKYAVRCDPLNDGYPKYEVRNEWEIRFQSEE